MTRDRDLARDRDVERVLEQWLTDGVNEMPDRVYQSIFDRVERQPQALAPRLPRRLLEMNGSLRWIAAAAAVVLVTVVGFAVLSSRPDSGIGTRPTPTPSSTPASTPSPSISIGGVPVQLFGDWVAETRLVPDNDFRQNRSFIVIDGSSLKYVTGTSGILGTYVSESGPGKLTFTTWDNTAGCSPADTGTYGWSLSQGGSLLTLTSDGDDECASRAVALPGTWTRSNCPSESDSGFFMCLGDLEPGTYRTTWFSLVQPPDPDLLHYGQLSYTVPAGWANTGDFGAEYELRRQEDSSDGINVIKVRPDAVLASQAEDCPASGLEGVDRSASAMAHWLASHPGLEASTPQPVTIAGFDGYVIDIALSPDWTRPCPFSNRPTVPLFADTNPAENGFYWGIGPDERQRIYLVDLGDGGMLWVDIDAEDESTFQALLPEATAIVESIELHPPTP